MDTTKCTEIIEKIGENHVVLKRVLYTATGEEVIVEIEEYGQDKIAKQKAIAEMEISKWTALKDVKLIEANITTAQANLTKVNLLETAMNGK
jgi:hypothetical protein